MQAADGAGPADPFLEQQKNSGADRVQEMAKAVHNAADELEQQMPPAAEFVRTAASRIERGAEALRERSVRDLVTSFNDWGRKEPLAVFGSAIVAGFALSRFLKSSAENPR